VPKLLTLSEAETKRRQAVEYLRRIGKDDDAARFDEMDAAEYAAHKGAELVQNPHRRRMSMAQTGPTKGELADTLDEIGELAEDALDPELTREELVVKLKEIADVATGEDEDDGEDDDGAGDDGRDDDLD